MIFLAYVELCVILDRSAMPQRTNEFQELVTLIQEALMPQGAKVTPSAMVPGPTSGALREIDILVETSVGPYMMKIAVEAKDEGRKLDATKMETIIGKYRGRGSLTVNQVVVVSHRGFTAEALTRAKDEDFLLFTIEEVVKVDWKTFLPTSFSIHVDVLPFDMEFDPPLPKAVDKRSAMEHGRLICNCHGYDYGSPFFRMRHYMFHNLQPTSPIIAKMHDVAVSGKGKADLRIACEMNHVLRVEDKDYPVNKVTMLFRYIHATGPAISKSYEFTGESEKTAVAHTQSTVGGVDLKVLLPLGVPGSKGVLKLDLGPPPVKTDEYKGPLWHLKDGEWIQEDKE